MRLLRVIRGVVVTAIVWAIPWAVFGGVLSAVVEVIAPQPALASMSRLTLFYAFFLGGAQIFAFFGALTGAAFAVALAASGRQTTFTELSERRMLALGAIGGAGVAGGAMLLFRLLSGVTPPTYYVFLVVATVLGAASAASMLRIARRSAGFSEPPSLNAGDRWVADRLSKAAQVSRETT